VFEYGFCVLCIGYGFRVIGFVGYWVLGVGVLVFQVWGFWFLVCGSWVLGFGFSIT